MPEGFLLQESAASCTSATSLCALLPLVPLEPRIGPVLGPALLGGDRVGLCAAARGRWNTGVGGGRQGPTPAEEVLEASEGLGG